MGLIYLFTYRKKQWFLQDVTSQAICGHEKRNNETPEVKTLGCYCIKYNKNQKNIRGFSTLIELKLSETIPAHNGNLSLAENLYSPEDHV